ncbi:hypothetical protein JTE90_024196 [Oedothorax gibbosus]|uniref:DNA-directed DNA polymerase n=1 Tax=Oedothorax gibbosus TaxID=931172 RepID=A0AAV6TZZ4_9ARAC|nr:hypothetical protein JTE90_024196 [Oedothorax gibbosus]
MFPLCKTCCETLQQTTCNHTNAQRALTGTWISKELKVAVKKGYFILKIYEVYHFKEQSDKLFRSYIDLFLKIKQEASGWPSDCQTEEDKIRYIDDYKRNEGVQLDATNIAPNPGLRTAGKLCLNSFWGRWGMNRNKSHLKYVRTLEAFNKLLTDNTKTVTSVPITYSTIARDAKRSKVFNRMETKNYRMVYNKRVSFSQINSSGGGE